jgi:hypothetical protein
MKRDNAGTVPAFNKRKEMDTGVPEVDVYEIGIAPDEDPAEQIEFTAVNERWCAGEIFQPPAFERAKTRFAQEFDIREGVTIGVFAELGDDERVCPLQRSDLAIDVEHFRLEEIGAKTGDESANGKPRGHRGRIIHHKGAENTELKKRL